MKQLFILGCLLGLLSACNYKTGSGNIIKQYKDVGAFTAVNVAGGFDVEIRTGDRYELIVEADDNIINDIIADVHNGQLKVRMKNGGNFSDVHLSLFITAPVINSVTAAASADIKLKDELIADDKIVIHTSSAGNIKGVLNAPEIALDASSGSEITVSGRTKNLDAEASSGASIKADDLMSENCQANASSGASIAVHASVQLNAKASSGSSIKYRGEAAVVKKQSSGGGIDKKD